MNSRPSAASISVEPADERSREDDLVLVERALQGDRDAFRMLVEKYKTRVYGIAFGMVGNPDDALDISQEAFIRVHGHLERFRGSSSFYTWLYRIVVNLCVDHLRRKKHDATADYEETLRRTDTTGLAPSAMGDPARELADRELATRLEHALRQLSPVHRAVLHLREVEGLSYKEIAEAMGCSMGTVMSRLFHARRRMQEFLADCLDDGVAKA